MENASVLIIDDDRFNRRLYQDLLEAEGFTVRVAASADDGLSAAMEMPPDLIVMDIEMPGMDGLSATRALKENPRTRAVPVLIITAQAMRAQASDALAVGGSAFLRKPLQFPEFQPTVQRLLSVAAR